MVVIVMFMAVLTTLVVIGIGYLFYEAIMDAIKPTEKVEEEIPQPSKLKFKKPNL